jgi:hypothetical protein
MNVFKGMEKTMIPTPTKAGHPRILYNEMNARVIYEQKTFQHKSMSFIDGDMPGMGLKWQ